MVFEALFLVFLTCSEKVNFGSSVMPSMVGNLLVLSILLLMVSCRVVEYSAGSGVKRVVCVLLLFIGRLFSIDQLTILLR